jgi:spore coat polysaccharide biosynthesis protein SpsF
VATGAGAVFLEGGRFPDGLDAECLSFSALERAWHEATAPSDREHVTSFIWRASSRFRLGTLKSDRDYSHLRWTVDNEADFKLVSHVYEALYREDEPFLMADILRYLTRHPDLAAMNKEFIGREGYLELWKTEGQSQDGKARR